VDPVRLDTWVWAARCFKTRSKATAACDAGQVSVNGARAKPAKPLGPGDLVEVRAPDLHRVMRVLALAQRRGPAPEARALYEDLTPPPEPRQTPPVLRERGAGRPTKRDRRRQEVWLWGDDG
jgi:ribosome-associated heat shock protein Hsp15